MPSRWKKYVNSLFGSPSPERDAILDIVSRHAPARKNVILLEAFANFFSKSNVAAEHQCFSLLDGSILEVSREGVYIKSSAGKISEDVLDSNIGIHNAVGPSNWALNFYGKYYGSLDPLNPEEPNES